MTNQKDIQLYNTEEGSGEVMILLHGNNEDSEFFVHQIPHYAKSFRVIAVDTRGHGKTERGVKPFTIRQFAEDLSSFMEEKEIAKATIFGFSDGANIALIFALEYPEKVNRLIINGANLNPKGVVFWEQFRTDFSFYAWYLISKIHKKSKKKAEMLRLMVKDPDIKIERLHEIKVETLVIAGTKDMIKEKHTREIYKAIPNAQLALIEGDHFIAKYRAKDVNKAVDMFLGISKKGRK
jgi:pimeloyl-ACP methyl ester carboxylesterase